MAYPHRQHIHLFTILLSVSCLALSRGCVLCVCYGSALASDLNGVKNSSPGQQSSIQPKQHGTTHQKNRTDKRFTYLQATSSSCVYMVLDGLPLIDRRSDPVGFCGKEWTVEKGYVVDTEEFSRVCAKRCNLGCRM